jgi:mannose-6-phosphate isomerase-like protein (cupin superfamily)
MTRLISLADNQLTWVPHAKFPGVRVAWLMQKSRSDAVPDCALVQMSDRAEVPEHVHARESDILYVLGGRATMWIAGVGDVALSKGNFLRIPPGVAHRPHSFEDNFTAFDFWPATPA